MNNATAAVPDGLLVSVDEWAQVQAILQRYVPNSSVLAFGSRVGGPCKPYSDLDLVLRADTQLSIELLAQLHEAFSESALPWKVDLLDWATLSESFRQRIAARCLIVQ